MEWDIQNLPDDDNKVVLQGKKRLISCRSLSILTLIPYNRYHLDMALSDHVHEIEMWLEEGRCLSARWISCQIGVSTAAATRY